MQPLYDILIVDDEKEIADFIVEALTEEGYTVHTVGDGLSALDLVRERTPKLVLLDLLMPAMPGTEVLSRLRASFPELPVVMMTASNDISDTVRALGAADYLPKPFDLERLFELVARFVPLKS